MRNGTIVGGRRKDTRGRKSIVDIQRQAANLRQRIGEHYEDMRARDFGDARIKQMTDRVNEIEQRYVNNIRNTKSAQREKALLESGRGAYMSKSGKIWSNDYELSRTNLRRRARSTYMGETAAKSGSVG